MSEVKKITDIVQKGAKFYNRRGVQVYPVTVVLDNDDDEGSNSTGGLGTSVKKGSEGLGGEATP